MKSAIFRADASPEIGGGHVMRCLTLADRLKDEGWDTSFLCSEGTRETVPLLDQSGHRIVESRENDIDATDWLVIDHYGLGVEYEKSCRPWAKKILVLDDMPTRQHDCDILLDQNLDRLGEDYHGLVSETTTLATGTAYALLRAQFAKSRTTTVSRPLSGVAPFSLLIAMGLTDPDNATAQILGGLSECDQDIMVDIVLGGNAPHLDDVRMRADGMPFRATVHTDVADMAELLAGTDLAVGAAGSSAWERCCLGVPTLLVVLAENQRRVAEALDARNAAVNLGRIGDLTPYALKRSVQGILDSLEQRTGLSENSALICDGLGVGRVALLLDPERARDGSSVHLRPALEKDAEIILAWQSATETRRYFRSPTIPTRDEHIIWFKSKLADPSVYFHIIEHHDRPAGVLRLEQKGENSETLEVNVLVAPEKYRLGIAGAALRSARRLHSHITLTAEVLPDNSASHALFMKSGFQIEEGHYFSRPKGA